MFRFLRALVVLAIPGWIFIGIANLMAPDTPAFAELVPTEFQCPKGYETSGVKDVGVFGYDWQPTCGTKLLQDSSELPSGSAKLPPDSLQLAGTDVTWDAETYTWHHTGGFVYDNGSWNERVMVRAGRGWVENPNRTICHTWDSGNTTCRHEGYMDRGETKLVPITGWPPVL